MLAVRSDTPFEVTKPKTGAIRIKIMDAVATAGFDTKVLATSVPNTATTSIRQAQQKNRNS